MNKLARGVGPGSTKHDNGTGWQMHLFKYVGCHYCFKLMIHGFVCAHIQKRIILNCA